METNKLSELVKIEQLPKLIVQTKEIGKLIDNSLKDIDKLECTEENKQEVKKRRTEINNTLKILEDKRKEIKKQVLEPYESFNEIYNQECKEKLQSASDKLSSKIETIEDKQYADKANEIMTFMQQYRELYHLDFISYDDVPAKWTLTTSMKSIKDQIKDFFERVNKDVQLIQNDEDKDKLMLEYRRNGFDYQKAKLTLIEEQKQLEELKQQMEQKQEIEKQEEIVAEKIEQLAEIIPKEINEDKLLVTFTVKATKEEIRSLKIYLESKGIEYE